METTKTRSEWEKWKGLVSEEQLYTTEELAQRNGFIPATRSIAVKKDGEKTRVDLIDAEWLEGVGNVLRFGANKYHDHNWRNGFKYSRLIAACFRHLLALMRGEDIDPESGLHHTLHLSCSVMFLHWHLIHKPELDDRWKN